MRLATGAEQGRPSYRENNALFRSGARVDVSSCRLEYEHRLEASIIYTEGLAAKQSCVL